MSFTPINIIPPFILKKLEGRNKLKKVLKNSAWLFSGRMIRMCVGLFVVTWVARYLGPKQFGLFNYVIAFVAPFGPLAAMGLNTVVVREIVRQPSCRDEIIGTAFFMKLAGGILSMGAVIVTAYIVGAGNDLMLIFLSIASVAFVFKAFDIIGLWFQSQESSKHTVIAKNTAYLIVALIKIGLILTKAPLIAFVFTILIEVVVGSAGLLILYKASGQTFRVWRFNVKWFRQLMRDSWHLIFVGIFFAIHMKIDQIMLKTMQGAAETGIYSAAVRVSELWYFIPVAISISVYPLLIRAYSESEDLFYHYLKKIMGCMFWFAVVFSLIISLTSENIINLLYGENYKESASVLSIHIYSGIVICMGAVYRQRRLLEGTTSVILISTIVGAVSNIMLNLWLIPSNGPVGAAIATLISYLIPLIFTSLFLEKGAISIHVESIGYVFKRKAWFDRAG